MNIYSAISRTQVQMVSSVGSIQGTFATFPDNDHVFNLIFDIVGLAFAVGGAPVWCKCMTTRRYNEKPLLTVPSAQEVTILCRPPRKF